MPRLLPVAAQLVRRVRQNHALEHATMHQIEGYASGARLAGCTMADGFLLVGPVPTTVVEAAVSRALGALRRDPDLALHPRCGTNLVVFYLLMAALLALGAHRDERRGKLWLWRGAAIAMAALLARPAGLWAQRNVTTTGHVDGLGVRSVRRARLGQSVIHYVTTQHSG